MVDNRNLIAGYRARRRGMSVEHKLLGQRLHLLSERALFWVQKKMLIVADAHFGKAQFFREHGVPVPAGTTRADLIRLKHLLGDLQPEMLLFLGDFVHGALEDPEVYTRLMAPWRETYADITFLLVSGNHDRHSDIPPSFRFDWIGAERREGPFVFTHQQRRSASGYNLAGHLHPAVALTGRGGLKVTLPCFVFGTAQALLPAFGGFTGSQLIRPKPEDTIFVIADDVVMKLPAADASNG
jgi:DNA ligase-associated metallophosphoesterase